MLKQIHISSFFDNDLAGLPLDEQLKRLFDAEKKREDAIVAEIIAKERAKEALWLENISDAERAKQLAVLEREERALKAEKKLLAMRVADRGSDEGKCVADGLYVGGEAAARNGDWLRRAQIRAVVNCTPAIPNCFEQDATLGIEYMRVAVEDAHEQSLVEHFEPVAAFIERHLSKGGATLVHCARGVSRSCSLVVATLMRRGMRFRDAYMQLLRARPCVSINASFERQLQALDATLHGADADRFSIVEAMELLGDDEADEEEEDDDDDDEEWEQEEADEEGTQSKASVASSSSALRPQRATRKAVDYSDMLESPEKKTPQKKRRKKKQTTTTTTTTTKKKAAAVFTADIEELRNAKVTAATKPTKLTDFFFKK